MFIGVGEVIGFAAVAGDLVLAAGRDGMILIIASPPFQPGGLSWGPLPFQLLLERLQRPLERLADQPTLGLREGIEAV